MELGKLVTAESCGCIYYFIIDDVHPDEPHHDELKHYYVVTADSSSLSYREAYGVLCRALCSIDNRTFLHRWHSLYEQIFGPTPYVQFVDAVRNSPLVSVDSFAPHDRVCSSNGNGHAVATNPLQVPCTVDPGNRGSSATSMCPTSTVAVFSKEATARRALCKMAGIWKEQPDCPEHASGAHSSHQQHGCCTPVEALCASLKGEEIHDHSVPQQPLMTAETTAIECAHQGKECTGPAVKGSARQPQQRASALLNLASRWRPGKSCSAVEARRAAHELQRQLQEGRERPMKSEQHCHLRSRVLGKEPGTNNGEKQTTATAVSTCAPKPALPEPQEQLNAVQVNLSEEEVRHLKQREELLEENAELKKQLEQLRREQSARIEQFLKDNEYAVNRMENALHKREEEVRAVYSRALQERDVRIAQLSQEILCHTHDSRQLALARSDEEQLHAQRAAHLEDKAVHLREWNVSLQRQLAEATDEVRRLRQRLEVMETASLRDTKSCAFPSGDAVRELPGVCLTCGGLPCAPPNQLVTQLYHTQQLLQECREENQVKSNELMRAAQLIDALKEGLGRVKMGIGVDFAASFAATRVQ
ncbi:conserved hypothetical protein [Leishmania braziliensis MHOM/BR/75/M2904]|uniref:Uncharacterized protein n=2 Tax=Leishmania braziliensis TaxID=5660 RepID=E9AIW7_LEIBR|nr:conserved hypothetical protein [Leishmania braziliensis MHOM/BR/75/M2904]KAI5689340.1 hypothetical protein MNV84_07491 [Leishmania braziliensis]CAJ2480387.1 unnamed protein product [Leishmania braziliensis]CBZ14837.1 conserved hypothetical protein [Leishmania braziliensis MHOM/BR/75/M2904]SYZ69556.1 hypothetical_protein [Leishmania braziliensis MHOM/BR/75/M2904]